MLVASVVMTALFCGAGAQTAPKPPASDTTRYPLADRYGDPYTYRNRQTFDFMDTGFVKRTVEYDPKTNQYYIIEKIGSHFYRSPSPLSAREFLALQGARDEQAYFRQRADLLSNLNRRGFKPQFGFSDAWVNRITGGLGNIGTLGNIDSIKNKINSVKKTVKGLDSTGKKLLKDPKQALPKIDIRPTGSITLLAGYQGQNIKNPTLPERARKTGGFDFDQQTQIQLDANIGDKIKLPINFNTQATFDFENQLKLDYHGKNDEILKTFQAGNISFASKGTLIPGVQSLFGLKSQLQFGKLFVTAVLGNQRSQRQSLGLQGGSSTQNFSIRASEYEENRHFLMGQYFRKNYNKAMRDLPVVRSNVQILRVEVWVTNRNGVDTNVRDVVAFMDLGERVPFNPAWGGIGDSLPRNDANGLYASLKANGAARNSTQVQSALTGFNGMQPVQDFEKTYARKLASTDYYFNPQIGFLSLNQPLQPDEVLGVAYQYTYNSRVYQVGEFSQDVPPDSTGNSTKVLFLKLLKATSQRTNLPLWDLMMKNVYGVGYGQLQRQDFKLDITYEEPSAGDKRYLPPAEVLPQYKGLPILQLDNLDRLNNQNDPQPDGVFDYVENFTVISSQSRIIFPVLEPFGHDLDYVYPDQATRDKYLFYPLYDTIKAIAQNFTNLDRFKLTGRSRSASVSSDYQLGFNIPRGSVSVTANGRILQENVDYEINYDLGTLRVTNTAIISSGIPVQIQYENNATFGLQQRNYTALRFDYLANKHLTVGATAVQLGERPFFTKQSYGDDPIRNRMYGIDFDYRNNAPGITKLLNKLPFYQTKAMSSVAAYGEAAVLKPGHSKLIGKNGDGIIYLDDFEGTRSAIDLRFPITGWSLASVPQSSPDKNGAILFPEAALQNNLASGYNRAKLAWYNIEPVLQERRNTSNPLQNQPNFLQEISKPQTRQVYSSEIFPQRTNDFGQGLLTTFDLAYYPKEKGPYNFQTAVSPSNGALLQPKKAWGGIQRSIDQTDFETGNVEFIEFWVQDPFINKPASTGGELYFDLGNISEDVLRDGKRQYENGLPTPSSPNNPVDETVWGKVPRNPIQITNAFSNDAGDRPFQDVGFDGLTDTAEQRKFAPYLAGLATTVGVSSPVYQRAQADPSADNFKPYRDESYDAAKAGILQRYKDINNPHGNSPVANTNNSTLNAFTLYPDQEELNRDNTLNEVEEYFQYRVELRPGMNALNNPYITDQRIVPVRLADGSSRNESWYLFRLPIREYQAKVGNIPDFKSIRFVRMFLTNFEDTAVLRFAKLELVRNQWRKFNYETDTTGIFKPLPASDPVSVGVLAVNLEENDQRMPIPYRQPPGIERQQQISNNNVQLFLNEQALSLRLCGLEKGKTRGVFKTMSLDLRQYGSLSMFVHAESQRTGGTDIKNGELNAVIRIGEDNVSNYYEIKIPLKITPWGAKDSLSIWPAQNNLDFDLDRLIRLKISRNSSSISPSKYYRERDTSGKSFAIIGNPNLGEVRVMLLGVENVLNESACAEVWFNELRLSKLNEKGGYAAQGRIDLRFADLGNASINTSYRSVGFGTLEQRVNERSLEDFLQVDASTNLDLGKLVPKKAAIQIPVFASVNKIISKPKYDPFDLDIERKEKLKLADPKQRDSIKAQAIDETTIKTVNFTNVKKNKTNGKKPMPWDISNIDVNYSYTHQQRANPVIELEDIKRTRGAVSYNFSPQPRFIEPLKGLIRSKSPWLSLIRDFNFNYKPSLLSFRADVFRQFGVTRSRNVGTSFKLPETFDKFFYFDRYYNLRWDLTKSLTLDFNAVNNARVDEPFGHIDTRGKKDSVRSNFLNGGRNTHYHQEATLSYTLPTAKLPLLDWTNLRASYTAKYDWIAASLVDRGLGNTLVNGQTRNITGDLDFERLYQKWKFLRAVYNPTPKPPVQNNAPKDTAAKKRKRNPNELPQVGTVPRFFARLATSVKKVGIQYTEDMGTLLPGYLDSTKVLGMNLRSGNPGWRYVLGYQPDTTDINRFAGKGLLSRDSLFNMLIQQRYNQHIYLTAQVSPLRDLNIDLTLDRTYDKQYSELDKDTGNNSGIRRFNPYATGSFSMSYISYQTLFERFDPTEVSATFQRFQANRTILSQRIAQQNVYSAKTPNADGYVEGYGRYAQDVLIPAFLAAYTKKDPGSIQLIKNSNPNLRANPFSRLLPKPNWNITYSGLTRIKGVEKLFTAFTIRHGYTSTLSMNSFTTALLFQDPLRVGFPSFRDTSTGNYIPYFLVPNISIIESFSPLIAADMTFTNQLGARFEYKKSRQLSLSLLDYQLAEMHSTEYTLGMDWRKRGVPLIRHIRFRGKTIKLDNDITFRLDYSLRDDATANTKLDQNTSFGTSGQKVVRLAPSIDYVINNRVNLKFYFEQNKVEPKIATTAPITTTRAGVQVRISLSQ